MPNLDNITEDHHEPIEGHDPTQPRPKPECEPTPYDPTQPRGAGCKPEDPQCETVKAGEPLPPPGSRPGHGDGTDKRKPKPKPKRKGLGNSPHGQPDQAGDPNDAGVSTPQPPTRPDEEANEATGPQRPTRPGPEGPHHAAGQAHRAKDATSPTHGPEADGHADDPIVAGGHGLTPAFLRSGNISFTSRHCADGLPLTATRPKPAKPARHG